MPLTGPGPALTTSGADGPVGTAEKSSSFPDPCPVNTALPEPATKSVDPADEPVNAVIPLNESLPPPLSPVTEPAGTDTTTPAGAPDKSSVADTPGPSKSTPLSVPGWNTTGTAAPVSVTWTAGYAVSEYVVAVQAAVPSNSIW